MSVEITKEWLYKFGIKSSIKKVDLDKLTEAHPGPYVTNMPNKEKTERENGNGIGRFSVTIGDTVIEVATW